MLIMMEWETMEDFLPKKNDDLRFTSFLPLQKETPCMTMQKKTRKQFDYYYIGVRHGYSPCKYLL